MYAFFLVALILTAAVEPAFAQRDRGGGGGGGRGEGRSGEGRDARREACREEARRVHSGGRSLATNSEELRERRRSYVRECSRR
ncbi:hypothetical protein ASE63_07460 [Bosea sp. Root381]|nr:hypothetical protein ASE63_07460 [Bosea sp. Root381]